jgi:hypothetical protein
VAPWPYASETRPTPTEPPTKPPAGTRNSPAGTTATPTPIPTPTRRTPRALAHSYASQNGVSLPDDEFGEATDDAALTEDADEPLAPTAEEIHAYNQHGTYAGQETTADFHSPAQAERLTVEPADAWEFTDSVERDEYFVGDLAAQLATLIGPDRTPADSAMSRQILDVVAETEHLGYRGQGEDRTRQAQLAELTGMTEFVLLAGDNLTDDQRAEALRIALDGHDLPIGAPVRVIGEDREFGTLTGAGFTNGYPTVNVRIDGRDASIGYPIERTVRAWLNWRGSCGCGALLRIGSHTVSSHRRRICRRLHRLPLSTSGWATEFRRAYRPLSAGQSRRINPT